MNSTPVSCSIAETVVILVTLPMSKSSFLEAEDRYIASVAMTAGVTIDNVQIISVNEISARRLLLATYVNVQTSVQIASGQQSAIQDQSLLNINLNLNGLPSGTVTLLSANLPVSGAITPAPSKAGEATEPDSSGVSAPTIQIGAIVGSIVGFAAFFACAFLYYQRARNVVRVSSHQKFGPETRLRSHQKISFIERAEEYKLLIKSSK